MEFARRVRHLYLGHAISRRLGNARPSRRSQRSGRIEVCRHSSGGAGGLRRHGFKIAEKLADVSGTIDDRPDWQCVDRVGNLAGPACSERSRARRVELFAEPSTSRVFQTQDRKGKTFRV